MSTIRTDIDPRGIATLTMTRADKRNALSAPMMDGITDAATALATDDTVRAVILAADGPVFSAGADLRWMGTQHEADTETRRTEARRLAMMLKALNDLPKPLIARVHGDAFGGGLGLMSVADAVIAASTARFGLTETRLGLIPATIGPYVIARLGEAAVRRVFASPRIFGADEAQTLGLVSRVVDPADLDAAVADEITPFLTAAPGAVAAAKVLVRRLSSAKVDDAAIEASIDALADRWDSDEVDEGTAAFFEKRKPRWDRS